MQDFQKILQLGYNQVKPSAGKVLLSEPFLEERVFSRAVILLIEHNDTGSFGLILNKPLNQSVATLMEGLENFNDTLFLGGPVEYNRLFFIFRTPYLIANAIEFMDGVFIGGDFEDMCQLMKEGKLQRENIRFFIGYSGWDAGQLDKELKKNTWVVSQLKQDDIFTAPYDDLWKIGLENIGGDYSKWNYLPQSPDLN